MYTTCSPHVLQKEELLTKIYLYSRIKEVGPDRACAEWLLKNGAALKWATSDKFLKDYNSLPLSGFRQLKVQEVDATNAAIMEIGFPYFNGLEKFDKLILKNCS